MEIVTYFNYIFFSKYLHTKPENTNFASQFTSTICESSSAGRAQPCQG
jgi:hypothetical protein